MVAGQTFWEAVHEAFVTLLQDQEEEKESVAAAAPVLVR